MSFNARFSSTAAVLGAVSMVWLFCAGCGDYFRPVANPVFQPGGDPQRTRHALVLSRNGPCATGTSADCDPGTAVVIDVSGDTNVATFSAENAVGRNPVHATNISGTDFVVNRDDNSVSAFTLPSIPSSLNAPNVISLPASARPVFAAAAQGKLFVAESGLGQVADVSPATFSVNKQIPVGNTPVALVATPDQTKLYCVNQADAPVPSVSVILPATDQVIANIPLAAGALPVWAAVSADGSRVFVVNRGTNNVTVINTATDKEIASSPLAVGHGPNYIVYQASQNRVYVTNEMDNSLSIVENATAAAPIVDAPIPLTSGACNGLHGISVTALADGTRAYVADRDGNKVCVLNTATNTFTKSIAVGSTPVFVASDSDSFRVYTANSGPSDVSIIQTSDDTTLQNGSIPLTICLSPPPINPTPAPNSQSCTAGSTPTFIAMTP